MLSNPLINLGLRISYTELQANSQKIHDGFITLIADYPTPNPTMIIFQGDIDKLKSAIVAWGPKGARGSHEQHLLLIAAAEKVRNDYRQLAAYAMNTKPGDKASWVALGFTIK